MSQGVTGQYYTSRIIEGPRALEAAEDFTRLAGAQVGNEGFPVTGVEARASIDLDEWPDEEGFGPWFAAWATRWNLTVED